MTIDHKVTTEVLWRAAIVFALIDVPFVILLMKHLTRETFVRFRPFLVVTSGVFWFVVWILMGIYFWDSVYHYVFPPWARWVIPPAYGILFSLIALLFWWIALRLPGVPVLTFCILGGLWGAATHLWGVSRGLIDSPPMLQGLSTTSVAIMPVFEFVFYWCVILSISLFLYRHSKHPRK
jgi:hypothetical protein